MHDIKNNPIVFLPEIVYLLFTTMAVVLFLSVSGISPVLQAIAKQPVEKAQEILAQFLTENLARVFSYLLAFVFVTFVVGSSLTAMKLGVVAAIVKKKNPTVKDLVSYRKYTLRVILLRIIQFLWYLSAIVASSVVFVLIYPLHRLTAFVAAIVVLFAWLLFVALALFFSEQHLYLKEQRPNEAVKSSFAFFKKEKAFVIRVLLVAMVIAMVASLVVNVVDKIGIEILSLIFNLAFYFAMTVYLQLFYFRAFAAKSKQR